MIVLDWDLYPDFTEDEFRCSHTGLVCMKPQYMERLQNLRTEYGHAMIISSGYRHPSHPIEAIKTLLGAHTTGCASDVRVHGDRALRLVALAVKHGFTGIGVHQRGERRFIHLDDLPGSPNMPRPWIWSY